MPAGGRYRARRAARRIGQSVALTMVLAMAACTGIDFDPSSHRVFARDTGPITRPPPGLLRGTSQ